MSVRLTFSSLFFFFFASQPNVADICVISKMKIGSGEEEKH